MDLGKRQVLTALDTAYCLHGTILGTSSEDNASDALLLHELDKKAAGGLAVPVGHLFLHSQETFSIEP